MIFPFAQAEVPWPFNHLQRTRDQRDGNAANRSAIRIDFDALKRFKARMRGITQTSVSVSGSLRYSN
jgi:hypothetical protein